MQRMQPNFICDSSLRKKRKVKNNSDLSADAFFFSLFPVFKSEELRESNLMCEWVPRWVAEWVNGMCEMNSN